MGLHDGGTIRTTLRVLSVVAAVVFALLAYVYLTLPDVRRLARENPSTTAWMEMRAREAEEAGRVVRFQHRWVPYSRISNNLRRAVLAAEDGAFFQHEGVDYAELRKVLEEAMEGEELRGASTLTQQLAKNLYLSPSRDPLRKLRELIITRRLEANLTKTRIFEIYLNVVEWGDGIWGAEAAARAHFGVSAASLSREQAALLAGALINPIRYSPSNPPGRLRRRQQIILGRMNRFDPPPAEAAPAEAPLPAAAPADVAPGDTIAESEPAAEPGVVEAPSGVPAEPPAQSPSVEQ